MLKSAAIQVQRGGVDDSIIFIIPRGTSTVYGISWQLERKFTGHGEQIIITLMARAAFDQRHTVLHFAPFRSARQAGGGAPKRSSSRRIRERWRKEAATLASMLSSPVSPYGRHPDSISTHQLNNSQMYVIIDFLLCWQLASRGWFTVCILTSATIVVVVDKFTPPSSWFSLLCVFQCLKLNWFLRVVSYIMVLEPLKQPARPPECVFVFWGPRTLGLTNATKG